MKVVEDAAQGFFASYKGRALGNIGDFGSISFTAPKTSSAARAARCLSTTPNFATGRVSFAKREPTAYSSSRENRQVHMGGLRRQFYSLRDSRGVSRRPARRRGAPDFRARRRVGLLLFAPFGTRRARRPAACENSGPLPPQRPHIFILADSHDTEKELEKFMKSREIGVAQHYAPLHLCPMARRLGCDSRPLPVSETLSKTMLRLPISPQSPTRSKISSATPSANSSSANGFQAQGASAIEGCGRRCRFH